MTQPLGRRDFLKLAGGALGLSALSYYLGNRQRTAPTPQATLPDYADNGLGFPVFRGPYLQKDARLAAFLFNADLTRLTELCDRTLNVNPTSPFHYAPASTNVMLVFADMLVSSRDERDTQVGLIPEIEVGFWMLTLASSRTLAGSIPHHLAWFLPYLLVDESNAIATGREVYGFNKQAAQFQKPASIEQPEFSADVLGFQQFGPSAIAQRQRLLSLKAASSAQPTPSGDPATLPDNIVAEFLRNLPEGQRSSLLEFATRSVNAQIPLVFLKQFRDAQDTRKACYQRLIEAPLTVETFHAGGTFPAPYLLEMNSLASHPIAQSLGLSQSAQASTLGIWLHLDFLLGNGAEI